MKAIFKATKKAVSNIINFDDENPDDEKKSKLFPTVKLDKGQFERIINQEYNMELPYKFPAVFIHFTDVHYLVSQTRLGEGRGFMVVKFILNRLNDQDDEHETEIFDYAGIINESIQAIKDTENIKRISLQYFDMPTSSNQLQPCILTYDVQFTDTSGVQYRDWIERKITTPLFTNRSDVPGETRPDVPIEGYEDQVTVADSVIE